MNKMSPVTGSQSLELIEHLAGLEWSSLPEQTRTAAVSATLDTIGCGLFGAAMPWGAMTAELALESSGSATVLGRAQGATPAQAAMANGTSSHGFEMDDIVPGALMHAGAVVVPAALAAAEHIGASGERLLLGVVAGYEVSGRLGFALGADHNNRGYHTTGVVGPIAAAVAASIVAGANSEAIARAVGIACSASSGLKAFTQGTGGMVKRYHAGLASQNGVQAWQLAAKGFTGPLRGIDGRYGLLEVIGGAVANAEHLSSKLGEEWIINRTWVKAFPCCGLIHTTAQIVEEWHRNDGINADDVETIRIGLSHHAYDHNGDPNPTDTMGGQYSIPYCAAVAMTRDVTDPASFMPEGLNDPAPRALIPRIELYIDEEVEARFPGCFGAKAELTTRDGRRFERTLWYPRGNPVAALTPAQVAEKFGKLTASAGPDRSRAIEQAARGLAGSPNVAALTAALRAAALETRP